MRRELKLYCHYVYDDGTPCSARLTGTLAADEAPTKWASDRGCTLGNGKAVCPHCLYSKTPHMFKLYAGMSYEARL